MAIFRLETKIIGRAKARGFNGYGVTNRQVSVVAKAAYRSGEKLKDQRNDMTFNHASRKPEVAHSEILYPGNAVGWLGMTMDEPGQRTMREILWNKIERVEKRKDSQLAREMIASLPVELSLEQGTDIVREWCSKEFVSKGFIVDFSIHRSRNGKNPHAHILCAMRPVEGDGFGKKPDMSGNFIARGAVGHGAKNQLKAWRESWEVALNSALEKAGREERVDSRSLKDQGLSHEPEPKIGVAAKAMERRGVVEDTDRHRQARQTRMLNEMRPYFEALQRDGYVPEYGGNASWWQRSLSVMQRIAECALDAVKGTWQRLIGRSREDGPDRGLERD